MAGFWELPAPEDLPGWRAGKTLGSFRHTITHHDYKITVETGNLPDTPQGFEWRSMRALEGIPLTTIARKALSLMTERPKANSAAAD